MKRNKVRKLNKHVHVKQYSINKHRIIFQSVNQSREMYQNNFIHESVMENITSFIIRIYLFGTFIVGNRKLSVSFSDFFVIVGTLDEYKIL